MISRKVKQKMGILIGEFNPKKPYQRRLKEAERRGDKILLDTVLDVQRILERKEAKNEKI